MLKNFLPIIICVLCLYILPSKADPALSEDLFDLGVTAQESSHSTTPFTASGFFDKSTGNISFEITARDGAYIYKDSIEIEGSANTELVIDRLPQGQMHEDLNGKNEVFFNSLSVSARLLKADDKGEAKLSFRGCDSDGICYPPKTVSIKLESYDSPSSIKNSLNSQKAQENAVSEDKNDSAPLSGSSLITHLALFTLLGATLDLTPCVLPLLGIFSAMIMGQGAIGLKRALLLNAAYLSGLIASYTLLGWIFASLGMKAHAFLSSPVFTLILGFIFVVLSLDCLGIITLKTPKLLNDRIQQKLSSQKKGNLLSALSFGTLSGLMTTPCTSAPLAGALLYIAKQGDITAGTLMFAAIGLGMGLPLAAIGLFGSRFLPKPGAITGTVRELIALPLLFAAFMIMQPLWDYNRIAQIAFAAILMLLLVVILMKSAHSIPKSYCATVGILYAFCTAYITYEAQPHETELPFTDLTSLSALDNYQNHDLYISFSAAWCGNCHVMDEKIYGQDDFKEELKKQSLNAIRFDLTDPDNGEIAKIASHFKISGVPAALIVRDGEVIKRIDGYHEMDEIKAFMQSKQ